MKISIIVPIYNGEETIRQCLSALINQDYPKEKYEIITVNDGSTDNTFNILKTKKIEANKLGINFKIINFQKNYGRVKARKRGAQAAAYEDLAFIDTRVIAERSYLKKLVKLNYTPVIANAFIEKNKSIFDCVYYLTSKKIHYPYWGRNFKPVYINKNNFDQITKGTGVLFCKKNLFLEACSKIDSGKDVSDDTKLLSFFVNRAQILRTPSPKAQYITRSKFKPYLKHIFNRGPKFVDYYLDPKKKYFWLFIFSPIAALTFTITLFFINFTYFSYWLGFLILIWMIVSIWLAESIKDFFIVFSLLPIVGFSFELGILKGLIFKLLRKY